MPQAIEVNPRPARAEITTNRSNRLDHAFVAVVGALALGAIVVLPNFVGPSREPAPIASTPSTPTPEPELTPTTIKLSNAPKIVIDALQNPKDTLLSDLQTAHANGYSFSEWVTCPSPKDRYNRTFRSDATKRAAPFVEARRIRDIEAGEPIAVAIEVVVTNSRRKDISETWMGLDEAGGITWAIKEQKLRYELLKEFARNEKDELACSTPFEMPDNILGDFRGPIQKIR